MGGMSRQPGDLGDMRPGGGPGMPGGGSSPHATWRWIAVVLAIVVIMAIALSSVGRSGNTTGQNYSSFITALDSGQVTTMTVNQDSGHITYTNTANQTYSVQGPPLAGDGTLVQQ